MQYDDIHEEGDTDGLFEKISRYLTFNNRMIKHAQ